MGRLYETLQPGDTIVTGLELPGYLPFHWHDRIVTVRDAAGKLHYLWTGWHNGEGHAKMRKAGKTIYGHREVVETVEERKLARWNYVDHKCERKPCLNYACLEAVTPGANTQRGPGARTQYRNAAAYAESGLSSATYLQKLREQYGDSLDQL